LKCFVHDHAVAVGSCRFCGRGLCHECAVEVQGALACRARCETAVANIAGMALKPAGPQNAAAAGSAVLGVLMALYGLATDQLFLLVMGAGLAAVGVASLIAIRRQAAKSSAPTNRA